MLPLSRVGDMDSAVTPQSGWQPCVVRYVGPHCPVIAAWVHHLMLTFPDCDTRATNGPLCECRTL